MITGQDPKQAEIGEDAKFHKHQLNLMLLLIPDFEDTGILHTAVHVFWHPKDYLPLDNVSKSSGGLGVLI